MKTINASDFKAKCLAILDDVERSGSVLTILKRGRPVAELHPASGLKSKFPQHDIIGSVTISGDILSPVLSPQEMTLEDDLL